ncbi:hypothetical protein ACLKA6_018039 [Drosophila palustris]
MNKVSFMLRTFHRTQQQQQQQQQQKQQQQLENRSNPHPVGLTSETVVQSAMK